LIQCNKNTDIYTIQVETSADSFAPKQNMTKPISQQQYNLLYDKVFGFFFRRVFDKQAVEELASETLSDFLISGRDPQYDYGYLWGIAKNKLRTYINSKSKDLGYSALVEDSEDFSYSPSYTQRTDSLLECAKNNLSNQDFEIVELSILCDFSSNRVSDETGLTPVNVRVKLSRSLKKLRTHCLELWKSY
jgi:DNA-directed RNA polymerase specialized sigma24 family protein